MGIRSWCIRELGTDWDVVGFWGESCMPPACLVPLCPCVTTEEQVLISQHLLRSTCDWDPILISPACC